jgi:excisionase family DNA binding protein
VIFGDRFYSVGELADVTGYHRDSIYRAIESGSLDAVKRGGRWLIAGSAINTWLYSGPVPRAKQRPAAVAASPQEAPRGRRHRARAPVDARARVREEPSVSSRDDRKH